jgi:basic amino acid/polyamine antiporter, APA family
MLVSAFYFDPGNFEPFFNKDKGALGVIEASTILFFGYLGFDFITTITEEALNPVRDVPKAIMTSVLISMVIYTLVAFSVSGVGNLAEGDGDGETALADIFKQKGVMWMQMIILVCAILGISAATLTNLMSQSRILYSYSKDGLFFKVFSELDPISKVPVKGSWISLVPIGLAAFTLNLI